MTIRHFIPSSRSSSSMVAGLQSTDKPSSGCAPPQASKLPNLRDVRLPASVPYFFPVADRHHPADRRIVADLLISREASVPHSWAPRTSKPILSFQIHGLCLRACLQLVQAATYSQPHGCSETVALTNEKPPWLTLQEASRQIVNWAEACAAPWLRHSHSLLALGAAFSLRVQLGYPARKPSLVARKHPSNLSAILNRPSPTFSGSRGESPQRFSHFPWNSRIPTQDRYDTIRPLPVGLPVDPKVRFATGFAFWLRQEIESKRSCFPISLPSSPVFWFANIRPQPTNKTLLSGWLTPHATGYSLPAHQGSHLHCLSSARASRLAHLLAHCVMSLGGKAARPETRAVGLTSMQFVAGRKRKKRCGRPARVGHHWSGAGQFRLGMLCASAGSRGCPGRQDSEKATRIRSSEPEHSGRTAPQSAGWSVGDVGMPRPKSGARAPKTEGRPGPARSGTFWAWPAA